MGQSDVDLPVIDLVWQTPFLTLNRLGFDRLSRQFHVAGQIDFTEKPLSRSFSFYLAEDGVPAVRTILSALMRT
jgi:hypothetical protein